MDIEKQKQFMKFMDDAYANAVLNNCFPEGYKFSSSVSHNVKNSICLGYRKDVFKYTINDIEHYLTIKIDYRYHRIEYYIDQYLVMTAFFNETMDCYAKLQNCKIIETNFNAYTSKYIHEVLVTYNTYFRKHKFEDFGLSYYPISIMQVNEMVNKVFDRLKSKCKCINLVNRDPTSINYRFEYVVHAKHDIRLDSFVRIIDDPVCFIVTYGMCGFCALQVNIYKYRSAVYNKESHLPDEIQEFSDTVKPMFEELLKEFKNNRGVKIESKPTTTKEEKEMAKEVTVIGMIETDKHEVSPDFIINELDLLHLVDHVIINPPATIVFWKDGTKTVVTCKEEDQFDEEKGLAMAITKKVLGNKFSYSDKFDTILKKAKRINDDSKAMITFTNNEENCDECNNGSCSCDEASDIPTNTELVQVISELTNQFVALRNEVDELKSNNKKKKSKKAE